MPTEPELDDAGCEPVPAQLVELHEVLEWDQAVKAARGEPVDPIPGPPEPEAEPYDRGDARPPMHGYGPGADE